MKKIHEKILSRHKSHWKNRYNLISTISGIVFFVASLVINIAATSYATEKASNNVQDLIISNVPVFNVGFVVNELALIFSLLMLVVVFLDPKTMPFVFKSTALFIVIRSAFITLTHLGPFPERSFIDNTEILGPLNLGSDFFFSGHTGLPFLMALIFWKENIFIRNMLLAASVIFGVSVLLGHMHYSIDVFAAFFITYSIFHIAQKFFVKDYALFTIKQ